MTSVPPRTSPCPSCGTPGSGKFCTECGTALSTRICSSCSAELKASARFCSRCGTTQVSAEAGVAGAPLPGSNSQGNAQQAAKAPSSFSSSLPWAVAGIAFLALFAMLAGRSFNAERGSRLDAPMTALPNPALDGPFAGMSQEQMQSMGASGAGMGEIVRAPDISGMAPADLAERLYNRVMLLASQGKVDSIQFFAPMAIQAFQMAAEAQGGLDFDQRYDIGRIAEVSGAIPLAKIQADTILQHSSDHLLGLILAARVARATGNTPSQQEFFERFARVKDQELAKQLPEYQKHQTDIAAGPPPPPSN